MASIGFGTIISHGTTQGGSYTALAQLIDCTPPVSKVGSAKTTHNESANAHTECLPGLIEGGEPAMKFNYAKTQHNTIVTLMQARTQEWWKITFPDGSVWNFQAHITELGTPAPMEERMETDIKMMITGKPTFTPAA